MPANILDGQIWGVLRARADREKTTVSELVREAVRERYIGSTEHRAAAMQSFVGIRRSRSERLDAGEEVRKLRRGSRLDRLNPR